MDNNGYPLRIGLSMRVMNPIEYHDPRDALAHDWYAFMKRALPEAQWVTLPNIGREIQEYISHWRINGIILTGGNDIGEAVIRDETEFALIETCLDQALPIFGVCRGLQIIQTYLKGQLTLSDPERHVAVTHDVRICNPHLLPADCRVDILQTNSYHTWSVAESELPDCLRPFALSDEGEVEGFAWSDHPVVAVMWHPERYSEYIPFDITLMRHHFNVG